MSEHTQRLLLPILFERPEKLATRVSLSLVEYSESTFTDPHTVVSLNEPHFDEAAYSHIGKTYEGVEPYRMGGHRVVQTMGHPTECVHYYDPNHREHCILQLEQRSVLQTLCLSTRFFAGNPASDVRITLIDDLLHRECVLPLPLLKPDAEHWMEGIDFPTTRILLRFKAGGITRLWVYGSPAEQQPEVLTWLSKNRTVLFKEDDFFGGPDFALSDRADRSNQHMLGWETSRSAMGLQAVFPITPGCVKEVLIDTYRHVNNYLRSAWVFSANLSENQSLHKADCPVWQVTSSEGQVMTTDDLKSFFQSQDREEGDLPTYAITPLANEVWTLETTFKLRQDAMHVQSDLQFRATHLCIMLLPHGGLHAIRVMGTVE